MNLQTIHDILTNTVEVGSIDYWATILKVKRNTEGYVTSFMLTERDDCDSREAPPIVDTWFGVSSVKRGLKLMATDKAFEVTPWIRQAARTALFDDDAGDMDVAACDVVIQAALFGKIIYG